MFDTDSWVQVAQAAKANANNVMVRFSVRAKEVLEFDPTTGFVKDGAEPKYVEVEYIEKVIPGDKLNMVDRPVSLADRKEFRAQYEDWKAKRAAPRTGTPLADWPAVDRAQVELFAFYNVKTVEDVAGLSEQVFEKIPGTRALQRKAIDWLEAKKGAAPAIALRQAIEEKDAQIEALRKQIADIAEKSEAQSEQRKRSTK